MRNDKANSLAADRLLIKELIDRFFGVFKNKNGLTPDWGTMNAICIPELLVIKQQGLEEVVYDMESFMAPRKLILTNGRLVDFEEYEVSGETLVRGNIAQHSSRYWKGGVLDGARFEGFGNKFFQLVRVAGFWKICAVVWEDE